MSDLTEESANNADELDIYEIINATKETGKCDEQSDAGDD